MSAPEYDFLNEPAPEAAPEPTPEPVAPPVEPVAPAATPPAAPTAADVEGTHVPLAALKAEREKRQQYERELAEIRKAQATPPEPPPNFFEQPEQYVQQAVQRVQQQSTQVLYAALEEAAREQYTDYDEVLSEVNEAARGNPVIRQQVFSSANPALAAYRLGKQLRDLKALQDPAVLEARIEERVAARIAQLKTEQDAAALAQAKAAAAIPPDLSAARSARDQPVAADDSLDSILATRRKR